MRLVRLLTISVALVAACSPAAFAQTAPKASGPVQPVAPVLFPGEAKFAFLDFQRVATDSVSGKLATRILDELTKKKITEIEAQNTAQQTLVSKRDSGVLSGPALAQVGKDMDKLQREIQFSQQNAQAEIQQLKSDLQGEFEKRVTPLVADIAKEKGLHAVFSADAGLLYIHPGLDISEEIIKRLDAQPKK